MLRSGSGRYRSTIFSVASSTNEEIGISYLSGISSAVGLPIPARLSQPPATQHEERRLLPSLFARGYCWADFLKLCHLDEPQKESGTEPLPDHLKQKGPKRSFSRPLCVPTLCTSL